MEKHLLGIEYYSTKVSKLTDEILRLKQTAEVQLDMSYSPYSHFQVGAAILMENNEVFAGCNQENASYPLCLCAERVALYNAGTRYPTMPIQAMFLTTRNKNRKLKEPASPCGACRQVISEFAEKTGKPFPIYINTFDSDKVIMFPNANALLPFSFSKVFLIP